jgi:hypothetical protein
MVAKPVIFAYEDTQQYCLLFQLHHPLPFISG